MTRAEANILAYLEAHGASTYGTIGDHFSLMSKGAIDDAINTLVEAGKVAQNHETAKREYWAISTGKQPKPTVYASACAWVRERTDEFTTAEFAAAMPNKRARCVEYLGVLVEKGEIVAAGRGRWRRNTPSEAAATRKAGAPAPSEIPEAVATPIPVGDAPDVSAPESPSPAMGPAAALKDCEDKWRVANENQVNSSALLPPSKLYSNEALRRIHEKAQEELISLDAPFSILLGQPEECPRDVERRESSLPHAEFRMTNGEVEIVITGSPAEVHRVVSLLDQALMA